MQKPSRFPSFCSTGQSRVSSWCKKGMLKVMLMVPDGFGVRTQTITLVIVVTTRYAQELGWPAMVATTRARSRKRWIRAKRTSYGRDQFSPTRRPESRWFESTRPDYFQRGRSVEIVGCADAHGCQLRRRLASSYAVGAM